MLKQARAAQAQQLADNLILQKTAANIVRAEAAAKKVGLPEWCVGRLTEVERLGLQLMNRSKRRDWLKANEKRIRAIPIIIHKANAVGKTEQLFSRPATVTLDGKQIGTATNFKLEKP